MTFEGTSNFSNLLTFVTIGINTFIYRLQHANKVRTFYNHEVFMSIGW